MGNLIGHMEPFFIEIYVDIDAYSFDINSKRPIKHTDSSISPYVDIGAYSFDMNSNCPSKLIQAIPPQTKWSKWCIKMYL